MRSLLFLLLISDQQERERERERDKAKTNKAKCYGEAMGVGGLVHNTQNTHKPTHNNNTRNGCLHSFSYLALNTNQLP